MAIDCAAQAQSTRVTMTLARELEPLDLAHDWWLIHS
jgi:hypothetical protein